MVSFKIAADEGAIVKVGSKVSALHNKDKLVNTRCNSVKKVSPNIRG